MSEKPGKEFIKQRRKVVAVVVVIVVIPILIYDIFLFGGNVPLYVKWIECGQKPVVASGSGFMNDKVPYYSAPPTYSPFRRSTYYFCTPLEAERAGYSASDSTKYFPELDKVGEQPPDRVRSIESLQNS